MTEYTDEVEEIRQKTAAEKWGKQVSYIHASDGIIETKFNNGDIRKEYSKSGEVKWDRVEGSGTDLMSKFNRFLADAPWYASKKGHS